MNVRQAETLSLKEALPIESERMARTGTSDEHREAVKKWLAESQKKASG